MSLAARRLARLARTGSPRAAVSAVTRELSLKRAERSLERALAAADPLVVGPFVGEVGYELLFWRPFVLRLLREHHVDRERVTIVTRGGAGAWYDDVAARRIDVFEVISPDELRARTEARVASSGQRKQVSVDALDRDLLDRVHALIGPGHDLHPRHMYWRARFLWEGLRPAADAIELGDYDDLPRDEVPVELAARLPPRFIAVKAYFNDCVPDTDSTRAAFARLVTRLAELAPVVLLEAGVAVDDHGDWHPGDGRVVPVADLLRPETNLAAQAAVVARAEALVATYGGYSYVGPFLGVPTVALAAQPEANPRHEAILRAAKPAARYERRSLDDLEGIAAIVGKPA